jgi:hypothetical protein
VVTGRCYDIALRVLLLRGLEALLFHQRRRCHHVQLAVSCLADVPGFAGLLAEMAGGYVDSAMTSRYNGHRLLEGS